MAAVTMAQANRALKRLPEFAKGKAQRVMDVTAFQVAEGARRRAPKRTGKLAGDLTWQSRPRSVSAVMGVAGLAYYWKFLEYGTTVLRARPFIRPAAMAVEADHESRLTRALTEAADQVEHAATGGGLL